jgi:hypothetical protein
LLSFNFNEKFNLKISFVVVVVVVVEHGFDIGRFNKMDALITMVLLPGPD